MNDKYKNKYRIPSARATWHNYDGGIYFVTICTHNMMHYFGEIERGEHYESTVQLSPLGNYLEENICNVTAHYPYAEIPLYAVMPNHVHLLLFINGDLAQKLGSNKTTNHVSVVVSGLKSAIGRFAKQNNIPFKWQERYHDHIVRNQEEHNKIAAYIQNNVNTWAADKFYNE